MALVSEIKVIQAAHLELLEALGISKTGQLAEQNPDRLAAEMKAANRTLSIARRCPSKSTISKWIAAAVEFTESNEVTEVADPSMPSLPVLPAVNYEATEDVKAMLANAPFAIPMPSKIMMENEIRVGDVPAGLLLNRYSGDLDVRLWDACEASVPAGESKPNSSQDLIVDMPSKADAIPIKAQPAVPIEPRAKIPKSKPEVDRVSLIRAPLESTNRGKNPNSRRYVRGVLHTQPWGLRIGAVSSLVLVVILPIAIVSALLLLLSSEIPESFAWVPQWIILFPLSLPLIGILYLIWGMNGKCRICNQKLFVHRAALKHLKAHHIPGFGYIVPLCLHLLLFSWFRCSSCGTPVRLKK